MTVIALIKSNEEQRTIAKATDVRVISAQAQGLYLIFTFPELRKVEQVLHVEVETNPESWCQSHNPQDKTYLGNTVGMSLYLDNAAGTTLTTECVVIGF